MGQATANLKAAFKENDISWPEPKTLFWTPEGPKVSFMLGTLIIEDLNPEVRLTWRMSRWEMFKLGFNFIRAAFNARSAKRPEKRRI